MNFTQEDKKSRDLEAVLILENGSIDEKKLLKLLKIDEEKLEKIITTTNSNYKKNQSVLFIQKKNKKVEFSVSSNFKSPILKNYQEKKKELSQTLVEVLSIVAYNQPVTKAEIDHIRGVNSLNYLKTLIEEKLIYISGKRDAPGKPSLFRTTEKFLQRFSIDNISQLPPLEDIKTYPFLN